MRRSDPAGWTATELRAELARLGLALPKIQRQLRDAKKNFKRAERQALKVYERMDQLNCELATREQEQ